METRSDELKRAYTGGLSIAPGHSRYRRASAQRASVGHEPAVTFLVERKWASKGKAPRSGAIPSRLFAYASIEGRRELCAVPTDVEDAREYRLRAQAGSYVLVTPPPALAGIETSAGAITCVLRTEAGSSTVYLLSCRHVFGMTASTSQHPTGAVVTRDDGSGSPTGPVLARTDNIYGPLSSGSNHNFDVAFARLEVAESALSEVLDRLAPVSGLRYVDGHTEIAQLKEYVILSPGGDKEATYVRGWPAAGQPTVEYERIGPLSQGVLVIELSVAGERNDRR